MGGREKGVGKRNEEVREGEKEGVTLSYEAQLGN